MVSNLVVEIAIYNFDLFHYTLLTIYMQLILVTAEHKGHGPHPCHHRVMLNK